MNKLKPHTFDDIVDVSKKENKGENLKPYTFEDIKGEIQEDTLKEELIYKEEAIGFVDKSLKFFASIWGLFTGFSFFVIILILGDFIASIRNILKTPSLWDILYIIASLFLLFILTLHIKKIFSQLKSLKDGESLKRKYAFQKESLDEEIIKLSTLLVEKYQNIEDLSELVSRLKDKLSTAPVYDELYKLNEEIYNKIDKKANKIIKKASIQSALATAASSFAILDMFLTFYRTVYLVNEISLLYGYKPGPITKYSILKQTLFNIAFAGASENLLDYIPELSATSSLNVFSKSLGQGLANGILMLRVGRSIKKACSPMDLEDEKSQKSMIDAIVKLFKDKKREEV